MGIKFNDVKALSKDFNDLKKTIELMKSSVNQNTKEVAATNKHIEEVKKAKEDEKPAWNEVVSITDEDRYPLVKTSEPGIKVETNVLMKKLDII